eukprot:TRINITY_DN109325_c0_g1_i1.p1 TRINITY_DN109325_c0_g1~~TRINITY_DN109325_c0_g1_i1.p1  ORF type:complete len:207 (+),score=46.42 TRINITY_DN109325_c0_g1_i1:49-669(+)
MVHKTSRQQFLQEESTSGGSDASDAELSTASGTSGDAVTTGTLGPDPEGTASSSAKKSSTRKAKAAPFAASALRKALRAQGRQLLRKVSEAEEASCGVNARADAGSLKAFQLSPCRPPGTFSSPQLVQQGPILTARAQLEGQGRMLAVHFRPPPGLERWVDQRYHWAEHVEAETATAKELLAWEEELLADLRTAQRRIFLAPRMCL